jgi:hypothetical protein
MVKSHTEVIKNVISISEYRVLTSDYATSDDMIEKRIQFLEAFCRNVAKNELEKYVKKARKQKTK